MKAKHFNTWLFAAWLTVSLAGGARAAGIEPKDPFDRLDGKGPTAMNVRVIDWAGNIELQISPMGKVKRLGFKIDRETDKNRPVLVIEYQWKHIPYRQIRRALLTAPLKEGFNVYHDTSYGDRDRYILTNHVPAQKNVVAFQPGPEPTQLWPDHHPNLQQKEVASEQPLEAEENAFRPFSTESVVKRPPPPDVGAQRPVTYGVKKPAQPGVQFQQGQVEQDAQGTKRRRVQFQESEDLGQGFDF